ncbi:hypothetical protein BJ138DRAFT_1086240 [Hygrophoropsis aurantiaca]|uniref:Uncharacterized protein n=1 Tax=Hygrophoropsis aurantiaca TaxID=72124 RepID=A0ACB8ACA8_9AGAM|nr:hypothetical protein BJ138DRAFT_1086240 [Hygrophoropsis aurantiaca]
MILNIDVIRLVFESLYFDVHDAHPPVLWKRAYLKDFVSLALTCRTFCSPALDILWSTQTSLYPLVATFPSDLWEIRHEKSELFTAAKLPYIFFIRNVVSDDWEIPLSYARRIKHLSLNRRRESRPSPAEIHITTLCTLLRAFPSQLLPNLSRLEILLSPEIFGGNLQFLGFCLTRLVHAKLRSLEFNSFTESNATFSAAVDSVIDRCVELEKLHVFGLMSLSPQAHHHIIHLSQPGHLHQLRSLKVFNAPFCIPFDALVRIGALDLEELHVRVNDGVDGVRWEHVSGHFFQNLRRLTLESSTLKLGDALLSNVGSNHLTTIYLGTTTMQRTDHLYNLLRTLAHRSPDFPNLCSLFVSCFAIDFANSAVPSLMEPLLSGSFNALRMLSIKVKNKGRVSLSLDIDRIPDALPALEIFNMPYLYAHTVTLERIFNFARRCKFLKTLGIGVNTSIVPQLAESTEPAAMLELLKVGMSDIGDPKEVAAFLRRAFPNLTCVKASSASEWNEEWLEVDDMITKVDTDE